MEGLTDFLASLVPPICWALIVVPSAIITLWITLGGLARLLLPKESRPPLRQTIFDTTLMSLPLLTVALLAFGVLRLGDYAFTSHAETPFAERIRNTVPPLFRDTVLTAVAIVPMLIAAVCIPARLGAVADVIADWWKDRHKRRHEATGARQAGISEGFRRLAIAAGSTAAAGAGLVAAWLAAAALVARMIGWITFGAIVVGTAVAAYLMFAGAVKVLGWIVAGFSPSHSAGGD